MEFEKPRFTKKEVKCKLCGTKNMVDFPVYSHDFGNGLQEYVGNSPLRQILCPKCGHTVV